MLLLDQTTWRGTFKLHPHMRTPAPSVCTGLVRATATLLRAALASELAGDPWGPVRNQSAHNSLCGTAVFQAFPDRKRGVRG